MPELPEVETIRRDLQEHLIGRRVRSVEVLRASVIVGPEEEFARRLRGRTFTGAGRHGKVLLIAMSGGRSLLVHLRMTGQLRLAGEGGLPRFARVVFHLAGGGRLVYADNRALGRLELRRTTETHRALARMGPDALEPGALDCLDQAVQRRRAPIKCLLLDQSVIAGIGNIYASEILHAARIAPDAPSNRLSADERGRLGRAVRRVLAAAVLARGTTFSDYRTGLGEHGRYAGRLRVYGREGEGCRTRGCGGEIRRCVQQTRSTFLCPECQK